MFHAAKIARLFIPIAIGRHELPVFLSRVPAGFPSPGDDFADGTLDLNDLVGHPSATFIVRVSGNSMISAGIDDGDLLVVDRSIEARHGYIVIAVAHGDMTVKRLERRGQQWWLVAGNQDYPAMPLPEDGEIWGVVAHAIKTFT